MKLLDKSNIKVALAPVDLNTAAAAGERVTLQKGDRVAVVINLGTSLTGAVTDITLKQHDAASAGNTKDLPVALPYFKKVGAATKFTKVEPTVAAANYVLSTDFDVNGGVVVFEIEAQDLDVNNGYKYFSVAFADSTVAKLASAIYVLNDLPYVPGYEIDV